MTIIKSKYSRLGVISDLHNDKETLKKSIAWFKKNPVDAIILAGDTPGYTKSSFVSIIKKLLKLDVPLIVFPGSHENGVLYEQVMSEFKKNRKVIDAYKVNNRLVKYSNWELIMIPGSDSVSNSPRKFFGGTFWLFDKIITPSMKKNLDEKLKNLKFAKKATPISIIDNYRLLEKKSKTTGSKKIVFSHIPNRCKTRKGIDMAHFGVAKKDFSVKKKHLRLKVFKELDWKGDGDFKQNNITPIDKAKLLKEYDYPIKIKKTHVGSELISKFLRKHRITKYVCGHIHESGKRAIDKKENKVKEKTPSTSLFINSGPGTATILKIKKNKISHQFI